jgi:phospholipase C
VRRALLLGGLLGALLPATAAAEPAPTTPIRHVITLMQDNHSFDNYFGTYAGADGLPERVCMPVDPRRPRDGCVRPTHVGNRTVQGLIDSPAVARGQLNGGSMNGFVSAITAQRGRRQPLVMGHYDDRDLPFYWNAADEYVLFDRFFASAPGGSLTNRMFWMTGGAGDKQDEAIPTRGFTAPTIFDRLERKGISWKLYVEEFNPGITLHANERSRGGGQLVRAPLLNYPRFMDDRARRARIVPLQQLARDMQRGTLPAVSYVVSAGSSEHPPGSLQAGENLVRTLVNGLMRSRYWTSSAFTWTYDGWGGWYDHVRPPRGYGFRVPSLLVSAYAKPGHVEHSTLDYTSILKFIERNWRLAPLTRRDARARGLMAAFDFAKPPRRPAFLTRQRGTDLPPRPVRAPIYVTYGAAFGVALLIILLALGREAVLRRRAPHLRGPSTRVRVAARKGRS